MTKQENRRNDQMNQKAGREADCHWKNTVWNMAR
jgi:hypothetical protein